MNLNSGLVAVITGAGSGIGRALAQALAVRGAALALADINTVALEETAKSCYGASRVSTHLVDVSVALQVNDFAAAVLEAHGVVNLVFNNAGVALFGSFEQTSAADFDWLFAINFGGVVNGSRAFLPHLKKVQSAALVNISSVFGLIAPTGQSAYSAAKFAVRGFTEVLRHELEGSGVLVACVHPGGIKTRITQNARVPSSLGISAAEHAKGLADMERLFVTSPEVAAATILRGLERNQKRILIGQDAIFLDWISRLMPISYWKILQRLVR